MMFDFIIARTFPASLERPNLKHLLPLSHRYHSGHSENFERGLEKLLEDTDDIVQSGEVELECGLGRCGSPRFASSGAAVAAPLRCDRSHPPAW